MKKLIVSIAVILITLCSSAWAGSLVNDTIWSRDVLEEIYMLKFSNNDSLIVAHGSSVDIFLDAFTGKEVKRIQGNCEIFFINNDSNFIRLNPDRKTIEIYDTQAWQVIDTLANDSTSLTYGAATVSSDEKYFVSVFQLSALQYGIRVWNIQTRKILQTKILQIDKKLNSLKLFRIRYINNNTKIIIGFDEDWYDDSYPNNLHNNIYYPIFDANTLDSIDVFALPSDKYYTDYVISKTDKYIVFMVADKDYGVHLYDLETKQLLNKFNVNGPGLSGIAFTSDDNYMVTSTNSTVSLQTWDLFNYQQVYRVGGSSFSCMDLSHDDKYIIIAVGGRLYKLYERYSETSSIDEINQINLITISPNPVIDVLKITFNFDISEETNIIISDTIGKINNILYSGIILQNQNINFDLSGYTNGAYILNIQNSNINYNYKIIINK